MLPGSDAADDAGRAEAATGVPERAAREAAQDEAGRAREAARHRRQGQPPSAAVGTHGQGSSRQPGYDYGNMFYVVFQDWCLTRISYLCDCCLIL